MHIPKKDAILKIAEKHLMKRTYLSVDFENREKAQRYGAEFDYGARKWYVEDFEGIEEFMPYDKYIQDEESLFDRINFFLVDNLLLKKSWDNFFLEAFDEQSQNKILKHIRKYTVKPQEAQSLVQIIDHLLQILNIQEATTQTKTDRTIAEELMEFITHIPDKKEAISYTFLYCKARSNMGVDKNVLLRGISLAWKKDKRLDMLDPRIYMPTECLESE